MRAVEGRERKSIWVWDVRNLEPVTGEVQSPWHMRSIHSTHQPQLLTQRIGVLGRLPKLVRPD